MDKIYFLVSQCDTWVNDKSEYLSQYFCVEGAFLHAFLIALILAIVAAAIFYGWIGNKVAKLSNLTIWLCSLLIQGFLTFLFTKIMVIGNSLAGTGIFQSIIKRKEDLLQTVYNGIENSGQKDEFIKNTNDFVQKLSDGCDVTNYLYLENVIISIILFFIISLIVKKMTKFAVYVPF